MSTTREILDSLKMLDMSQRHQARFNATEAIIAEAGKEPTIDDIPTGTQSRFSPRLMKVVTYATIILFMAGIVPSSIRLYDIGYTTFNESIRDVFSAQIGGIAAVMWAETGMIVFALALAVFPQMDKRWFFFGMVLSTAVAIVGNITIAKPQDAPLEHSLFAWFEAIVPSIVVFITSFPLKGLALEANRQQHRRNTELKEKVAAWLKKVESPHRHPDFVHRHYASLQETLIQHNTRGRSRMAREASQIIQQMGRGHWQYLIQKEKDLANGTDHAETLATTLPPFRSEVHPVNFTQHRQRPMQPAVNQNGHSQPNAPIKVTD